jgi:RNA polymerase sigma factor (sigma-70 family)
VTTARWSEPQRYGRSAKPHPAANQTQATHQSPAMYNDSIHFDSAAWNEDMALDLTNVAPEDGPSSEPDRQPDTQPETPTASRTPELDISNLMTLYLRDVRRYPALSADQETALWQRLAAGETQLRQTLVCHHLGLVIALARRFTQRGLELLDLIEEGNLALLVALDKFDPARGVRFSTYAGWWIRYFLQTALAHQVPIVRPPLRAQKRAREGAWSQWQALHAPSDGCATPSEPHIDHHNVGSVVPIALHDADAEQRLVEAGQVTADVFDSVADARDTPRVAALLHELVADLPTRQRELLVARYGLDGQDECSLADLGKSRGVSRERMRQVQVTALLALRQALEKRGVTPHACLG